jgi:DNA processing protein
MFALISLHRLTAGHPGLAQKLVQIYGSSELVLSEFDRRLTPIAPAIARAITQSGFSKEHQNLVEDDCSWGEETSRHLLSVDHPHYPFLLKSLSDPPFMLFVWGDLDRVASDQIAIVGSRKPTPLGISNATRMANQLAEVGFTITSGMAIGIDAAAHRGAVEAGGCTIAVQGCGADRIYPRSHERLALRILERGCLVSEYPTGFPAHARHFPQRNRIVTGLSRGTLVVEATEKSGSLISARLAMEQGREVFAIPGSIRSRQSEGCHQLIKQGAKLATSVLDIIEEFHDFEVTRSSPASLSENEQRVMSVLQNGPRHADRMVEETRFSIAELLAILIGLEIKGEIESGSDGYMLRKLS